MKKLLSRIAAVLFSAVITAGATLSCIPASAAEDTAVERTISFNVFEDGVNPSKKTEVEKFQTYNTTADVITVPSGSFEKKGYSFDGWTIDGIYGYAAGDAIILRDLPENVVIEPLWVNTSVDSYCKVIYDVNYNGEELEWPEWLPEEPFDYYPGQLISPNMTEIQIDAAFSRGWYCGDLFIDYNQRIVMPDHDIVLTPRWIKRLSFTFTAGDVDRITGNTEVTFPKNEGSSTELADADRFSRIGFNLTGWVSSYDGETYAPTQTVTVPSENVTFTAVWTPKNYTVVFKSGVSGIANKKIQGLTDSAIICPELERSGYTLTGWKYTDTSTKETSVYAPGQEFVIPGALPGLGISLEAVWTEGEAVVTSTATTATTSATSTTSVTSTTEKTTSTVTTVSDTSSTSTTVEMRKCEICEKLYPVSELHSSPLGVIICKECSESGYGGTTSKPTSTSTSTKTTASTSTQTTTATNTTPTNTTTAPAPVRGDANCDGVVTVADAVAILQYLANSSKYPLSEQGKKNADVDDEEGLSAMDALVIQKYDAGSVEKL